MRGDGILELQKMLARLDIMGKLERQRGSYY